MWRLRAFRLMAWLTCLLPRAAGYRLARAAGTLLSLLPSARRLALRANLAVVYGAEPDARRVRRAARRAFQCAMLNYVDLFLMGRADTAGLVARIPVPRRELIDDALARGKGLILVSAHLGNDDLVVQWLGAQGFTALVPVEPIEPPELREYLLGQRNTHGVTFEAVGPETLRRLGATLRAGNIVVLVSDRDIQGTGRSVRFFGRQVQLPSAAVLLALRTRAPVVCAVGVRHLDNSVSARLTPLPIAAGGPGGFRGDLAAGMREMAAMLEREIRRDPGQWVVQQPLFDSASAPDSADPAPGARRPLEARAISEQPLPAGLAREAGR